VSPIPHQLKSSASHNSSLRLPTHHDLYTQLHRLRYAVDCCALLQLTTRRTRIWLSVSASSSLPDCAASCSPDSGKFSSGSQRPSSSVLDSELASLDMPCTWPACASLAVVAPVICDRRRTRRRTCTVCTEYGSSCRHGGHYHCHHVPSQTLILPPPSLDHVFVSTFICLAKYLDAKKILDQHAV